MSITREAPSAPGPAVPTAGQVARRWWRAARVWILLGVLLVLVALPAILRQDPDVQPLGTDSARPDGGRALARVLTGLGVTVHPAGSLPEALELTAAHPTATLLFHDPAGHLPAEGLSELAGAVTPERRVLVEPGLAELTALAPGLAQAGTVPEGEPLPAGDACRLPAAREASSVAAGGRSYRTPSPGDGCFPVPGSGDGPAGPAHAVVASEEGTVVLGHLDMVANAGAGAEGHAVLALWNLGSSGDVIWYLPTLADVPVDGQTPTLQSLLPDWVRPAALWSLVCLLVLLLWKGRRHGPLAVEPLPVLVPASETAVGRARLYERSGQHAAAARTLRSATLVRLSTALRLGPDAPLKAIVAAAAAVTGRDAAAVARVLDPPDAGSARELVGVATALQDLEDEVHRSLALPATESSPDTDPDPHPDPRERTP